MKISSLPTVLQTGGWSVAGPADPSRHRGTVALTQANTVPLDQAMEGELLKGHDQGAYHRFHGGAYQDQYWDTTRSSAVRAIAVYEVYARLRSPQGTTHVIDDYA